MSINVLIVDDHLIVRQALAQLIMEAGISVLAHCGSGGEGLHAVRSLNPDVVLLDVRMPEVDGFTALSQIRTEKHPVKVLMITSYDEPEFRARAMELGADGFLSKSSSCETLIAAIRQVVEQRPGPQFEYSSMELESRRS